MFNLKHALEKLHCRIKGRRRILLFSLCAAYILYYLRQVRKVRVVMKKDDPLMTQLLLNHLKLHESRYWPLFIAPGRLIQGAIFLVMMGKSQILWHIGLRKVTPYKRTVVSTDQGDAVLHWVSPPAECEQKPIVVIFPCLVGTHGECLTSDTVDMLIASSYEVVVYNRRGHENASFFFSVLGDPNMTEKVLAEIVRERPGRGLFLIGFSAGACTLLRYMQDMAMGRRGNPNDVRFASIVSPGYSTLYDADANLWFLNLVIFRMNIVFLSAMHDKKAPEIAKRLRRCFDVWKWFRISAELSGYGTFERHREHCCPGYDWPRIDALTEAELAEMKYFPAVVFNARDDIFFPWACVKKYAHFFRKMHSLALIDSDRGGHCSYLDSSMNNWAVKTSIRIFDQVVTDEAKKKSCGLNTR